TVHPEGGPHPSLQLSADDVAFEAESGGASPAPETVEVTSSGDEVSGLDVTIEYGDGEPTGWLTAILGGTTTPEDLELSADITGLDPGTYTATVTVTGSDAEPAVLNVTLTVHPEGG